MRNIACRVLAVLLMAAAGALIAAHLHWPVQNTACQLRQPQAALRAGERMETALPCGQVQVNRAGPAELDALCGVGPAIARRIVEERTANGPFHYPEDLLAVNGIGLKTLQKIRPEISMNK